MRRFLILITVFALLAAGCAAQNAMEETTAPTVPAETEADKTYAPDFTVVDADGNELNLSDYFGKPIILNFWASWCGPCKSEMPDFDEAYREYGEDIHFLMVNLTDGSYETLGTAKSFVEGSGYGFPVFYDTASEGAMTYGVSSIPRTYFIDADGAIVAYAAQAIDADTLQQGIDMIVEE